MLGRQLSLLTVQVTHSIHKSFLWETYTPSSFRVSVNIICCVCKYESESVSCSVCPTLCDPVDCSLPGSSILGILQTRILEWVAIPSFRRSSQSRDRTQVSCIAGRFFTVWATREAPWNLCKNEIYECQGCHPWAESMSHFIASPLCPWAVSSLTGGYAEIGVLRMSSQGGQVAVQSLDTAGDLVQLLHVEAEAHPHTGLGLPRVNPPTLLTARMLPRQL